MRRMYQGRVLTAAALLHVTPPSLSPCLPVLLQLSLYNGQKSLEKITLKNDILYRFRNLTPLTVCPHQFYIQKFRNSFIKKKSLLQWTTAPPTGQECCLHWLKTLIRTSFLLIIMKSEQYIEEATLHWNLNVIQSDLKDIKNGPSE